METVIKNIDFQFEDEQEIEIENLWNELTDTNDILLNENNNEMISLDTSNLYIDSLNGYKPIKHLFKHYVTKTKFIIETKYTQPLQITCDHSIMVKRDNKIIDIKLNELKSNDKLIINGKEESDFTIYQIPDGYLNNDVYDIQVGDESHTFYGNNILLHNSIYVRMDAVLQELFNTTEIDWNNEQVFDKVRTYVDKTFQIKLNTYCADFICNKFFTDQRRIEFKRQKISAQGEYTSKKHYIVHVYDNEGLPCNKWAYAGVEIKKNELPNTIKELLRDCVEGLIEFNWDNNKFQNKIMQIYNHFNTMSKKDIAWIKNLSTPKNSTGFLSMEKGAGAHAKAAEFYNQVINNLGLTNKYELIRQFDRFHYLYIKSNNKYGINVIGFKDRWPKEFDDLFEVDKIKMFEKAVIAPFKKISQNHGYSTFNPTNIPILGTKQVNLFDL